MKKISFTFYLLALASCQTFESFLEQPDEMSNMTLCIKQEIELIASKERQSAFAKEIRKRNLNCSRYSSQIAQAKKEQSIKMQQAGQQMQEYGKAKPLVQGGFVGSSKPNPPKITRSTNSKGQGTIIQPSSGNNQPSFVLIKSSMSNGGNMRICEYQDVTKVGNYRKKITIKPELKCPNTHN